MPPTTAPSDILQAYPQAVYDRDVAAFADLFWPQVRVFDMWAKWEHLGQGEWRGIAEDWFSSLGDERVRVTFDEVKEKTSGDLAVVSAFVTFAGLSASGEELRSMNNRMTWVLERRDGEWKVLHEHSSAPVDQTGKVILKRK